MESLATGYEGSERRRKQRRIGVGRRVFADRRVEERRFDRWNNVVADERRSNSDRRKSKRRFEKRRKNQDRRAARFPRAAWEIEVSPDTPLPS
ncbi:MAG TPA: hypothetical protein VIY96_11315 [Thermoanaerobaculia bacterium]